MGIPKFFRWLSERYPMINQEAKDLPDIDNFYLDINGIIHQCSSSYTINDFIPHLRPQEDWSVIWGKACKYIEKLVALAKPQKLLYIALDGVPPRAKMNNQRERRYKAAQDIQKFIAQERASEGEIPDNFFVGSQISPATDFMMETNRRMQEFIKFKIQTDDLWREIRVILSGTDVVGEGEHKIQQYFRCTEFPVGTTHCIYGLDADLILLGLISHQPFTFILREEVSIGSIRSYPERRREDAPPRFQCLFLDLLRDYLKEEVKDLRGIEIERFVDDLVLLTLFVGNDFLPRIPTF